MKMSAFVRSLLMLALAAVVVTGGVSAAPGGQQDGSAYFEGVATSADTLAGVIGCKRVEDTRIALPAHKSAEIGLAAKPVFPSAPGCHALGEYQIGAEMRRPVAILGQLMGEFMRHDHDSA